MRVAAPYNPCMSLMDKFKSCYVYTPTIQTTTAGIVN